VLWLNFLRNDSNVNAGQNLSVGNGPIFRAECNVSMKPGRWTKHKINTFDRLSRLNENTTPVRGRPPTIDNRDEQMLLGVGLKLVSTVAVGLRDAAKSVVSRARSRGLDANSRRGA